MEVIKIVQPTKDYIDNTLNEQECEDLFSSIKEALKNDTIRTSVLLEDSDLAKLGNKSVNDIIKGLTTYIKNDYHNLVDKLYDHAKEINDIYNKIAVIIDNDKIARFKHRNDIIKECMVKTILMWEKNDHSKVYYIKNDVIGYDPESVINLINHNISYAEAQAKDKSKELEKIAEEVNKNINNDFKANHGYTMTCEPIIKEYHYKNQKLKDVFKVFENNFGAYYQWIYIFDKSAGAELTYMQYLQTAYNKMSTQYAKDKAGKKFVDSIFKNLLNNITISIDFNHNLMKICNEVFKFYAEELEKIYEIYKS